jgi:hypothetical protein
MLDAFSSPFVVLALVPFVMLSLVAVSPQRRWRLFGCPHCGRWKVRYLYKETSRCRRCGADMSARSAQ